MTERGPGISAGFAAMIVLAGFSCPDVRGSPMRLPVEMKKYDTPYYVLWTDLDIEKVREVAARITCMAREYHERTRDFSGAITKKFPFYLFKDETDYYAAGGPPGSGGVYNPNPGCRYLMSIASEKMGSGVWHTIQHEGFHQFAHCVITEHLPAWLDEGLAEYFGEGIWTGDNIITGVIQPYRLQAIKAAIEADTTMSTAQMLTMSRQEWNGKLKASNYDQAWSMVHFLIHADPKYQQALCGYIKDVAGGQNSGTAFTGRFGSDTRAFAQKYKQYWNSLDGNPTIDLFLQAETEILTSFLARATFLRMKFKTADEFFASAREGKIRIDGAKNFALWLPQSLADMALANVDAAGDWSLDVVKTSPHLVLTARNGARMVGAFSFPADAPPVVKVTILTPSPHPTSAPSSRPAASAPTKVPGK